MVRNMEEWASSALHNMLSAIVSHISTEMIEKERSFRNVINHYTDHKRAFKFRVADLAATNLLEYRISQSKVPCEHSI